MPVLLTRPATAVARATASVLLDDGAQVRLFGPDAPAELRARGAFVASGDPDDHGLLEAALAQVHTLVHVGPGLGAATPDALEREAGLVIGAAERAGVERLVVLSLPGAGPTAGDAWRVAAGSVEALAAASPIPSVVVRTAWVDTPAARDVLATAGSALDDVVLAPVRVEDVAAGLLAIDEARSRSTTGHVVFHAIGPEPLTVAEYLRRVGVRDDDGRVDLVGRTYTPGSGPLRAAIAGPWQADDDAADLWAFAERQPQEV